MTGIISRHRVLVMKAAIWRAMMAIGMKIHHFAEPKPPGPSFKIVVPSRLSPGGGKFKLVFYVPDSYYTSPEGYQFPVVVNYHGGGFTLGTGTDDARWAAVVVQNVDAVFVSVEYRLAPEHPFSTGVEDGTDAVIYLASHAKELHLDPHRIALSGFSAGGNYAFTVPLMLHDLQHDAGKRRLLEPKVESRSGAASASSSRAGSTLSLPQAEVTRTRSSTGSVMKLSDLEPTILEIDQMIPNLTIKALVSFYPPTDFRISREEKRATNVKPKLNLSPMLANLFDESYLGSKSPHEHAHPHLHPHFHDHLHAPINVADPYLSPAAASSEFLKAAYPQDIILYTCEYDMLNKEGIEFGDRLGGKGIQKTVHGGLIKEVVHAFDKKPNPIKFPKAANKCYSEACAELSRIFGNRSSVEERAQLSEVLDVDRFDDEALLGEGDHLLGKDKGKVVEHQGGQRLDLHYQDRKSGTSKNRGDNGLLKP